MMKKTIAIALVFVLCLGAVLCGCSPKFDTPPDKYEGIRWITYDYSFCINPADECKGYYKFGDTKYNIQAVFDNTRLSVIDTDNADNELFYADWMFEKNDEGEDQLYIYNIAFNKDDYEAFENNYAEFVTLKQEKI